MSLSTRVRVFAAWSLVGAMIVASSTTLVAQAAAPNLVSVSGTVGDAGGVPVAGQRVGAAVNGNQGSVVTTTDANGFYSMLVLPGDYRVQFAVSGFLGGGDLVASTLLLTVSQDTVVNLAYPATPRLNVHVVDSNGAPLPNSTVLVFGGWGDGTGVLADGTGVTYSMSPRPSGDGISTCTTDDTGTCALTGLPNGSLVGQVYPPMNIPGTPFSIPVTSDPTDATITIQTAGFVSVSGTVVDAAGVPVAGQRVGAAVNGNQGSVVTTTDANGFYSMLVLPGDYRVQFAVSGFLGGGDLVASTLLLTVSQDTVVNLAYPATPRLNVHVVDSNGAPLPNSTVLVFGGWG